MFKKYRKKFIIVAMCSVAAVLFIILGSINLFNYVQTNARSDAILDILVENDGEFPLPVGPNYGNGGLSGETPFEARYFTATVDIESGKILVTDLRRIFEVTKNQADEYVYSVMKKDAKRGRINGFKYAVVEKNGLALYVFLDCQNTLFAVNLFAFLSVIMGVIGLIGVFLLILLLSKLALLPVEESYKKQKSFITNAGHDLKTPLAVINAEVDLLNMDYGKNEYTEEIKNQTEKLARLTEKLIFLAKAEEPSAYPFSKFDLSSSLKKVIATYEKIFISEGFDFSYSVEDGAQINGNEELIESCFSLIFDNALKYTDENGKITVSLKKANKRQIVFYNDAKGLKQGDREELFERFYREDSSRSGLKQGNGIGLSVVKTIIENHKGKVSANADENGLTVTITLQTGL